MAVPSGNDEKDDIVRVDEEGATIGATSGENSEQRQDDRAGNSMGHVPKKLIP